MLGKFGKEYVLRKVLWISAAHRLPDYVGPCASLHGHNWKVTVVCGADELDEQGMVVDFAEIKKVVKLFDHESLNKFLQQPTAENIAQHLCHMIPKCLAVGVEETEGSEIWYTNPNPDTT